MIASTQELQQFIPANTQFKYEVIRTEFQTTLDFSRPFIEKTLYDEVLAKKTANTLGTGEWKILHDYYCRFEANWSLYNLLPKIYSSVSDAGVRVANTETHERSPKWSYEALQQSYFNSAYIALDGMMRHIHLYCMTGGSFYSFVSNTYRSQFGVLIPNVDTFNESCFYKVNFFVFKKIAFIMDEMIDRHLRPSLGTYVDTLIAKPSKNPQELKLLVCLRKIIANNTLLAGLPSMTIAIDNEGIKSIDLANDETRESMQVSDNQILAIERTLKDNLEYLDKLLKRFIKAEYSNLPGITNTLLCSQIQDSEVVKRSNYANEDAKGSFFI